LADALATEQRVDEALAMIDLLLVELRRVYGPEHSVVSRAELARLDALQAGGQSDRMRKEGQVLVSEITRRYGRASGLTARAEVAVAAAFIGNADYAQAAEHTRRAAESFEQSFGVSHSRSYRTRFNLGSLLWRIPGRSHEAEAEFAAALANAVPDLPENDPTLSFFRLEFAKFLLWSGKPERALHTYAGNLERLRTETFDAAEQVEIAQLLVQAHAQSKCGSPVADVSATLSSICSADESSQTHCIAAHDLACALSRQSAPAR
jgi:hypothetical protein